MIVAIHQPNFLPWLGFFDKLAKADVFVLLDNVQFVKGHICNRNKIKNNKQEAVWITVPVSHKKGVEINFNELPVSYDQKWGNKILNVLRGSYSGAPHFDYYINKLHHILVETSYASLAALNAELIKFCCSELGITTRIETASEQGIEFGEQNAQNINICKYFGADTYFSGQGARKYNDEEAFRKAGLALSYQEFEHPVYNQLFGEFIPNLSVIDLLLNEGKEAERFFQKN